MTFRARPCLCLEAQEPEEPHAVRRDAEELLDNLVRSERKLTDKEGRAACTKYACYQANNHATIMKDAKTVLTGDKSKGWTVTGPGLKAAAALVKEIAG